MSNQRVTKITRSIPYTATYSTGTGLLTVVTSTAHFIETNDKIRLSGMVGLNGVATVIDTVTFTVPSSEEQATRHVVGSVEVDFFRTGQTGRFPFSIGRSSGSPAVMQSFVTGAGGAVYDFEVSLDGIHWVTAASAVTHPLVDGDSDFQSIAPAWVHAAINITSIGVATKLEALLSI